MLMSGHFTKLFTVVFFVFGQNEAEDFLKDLDGNISQISFSYDEFHKEYIDIDNIKNLIDIAFKFKINTEIVGCFLNEGLTPGEILDELDDYAYITDYYFQPVIKTGSANKFNENKFIRLIDTNKDFIYCPGFISSQFSINVNLDVYPCCSQVIENTILKLGNLKESNLVTILNSIKTNYIFHTIYINGFKPFLDFMNKRNIEYPRKLSSPCELCEFLFKTDWFLRELYEAEFFKDL